MNLANVNADDLNRWKEKTIREILIANEDAQTPDELDFMEIVIGIFWSNFIREFDFPGKFD